MPVMFKFSLKDWDIEGRLRDRKYLDELTRNHGRALADYVLRRVQETLRPGGKPKGRWNPVGASGQAAKNLEVVPGKHILGAFEWQIVEGEATPANYFIRSGFKGHGPEEQSRGGSGGGETPVIRKLRTWAARKGISFSYSGRKVSYRIQRSRKGKEYARATSGAGYDSARVLYLIRRKLWVYGSKYSNWVLLHPKGRGRFDYWAYVFRYHDGFIREMKDISSDTVQAWVNYVTSGRKQPGLLRIGKSL